jgi:hypothetical protein
MELPGKNKSGLFNKLNPDIIAIIFLVISGLKLLHGVDEKLDLPLNDEAFYIYRGLSPGLQNTDWGFLYSAWYSFLNLFISDPVELFYLNFKLTALLPPLIFYFLLRKNNVKPVSSMLVTWMLLISIGNLLTIPRISHLALVLVILPLLFLKPDKKFLLSGWIMTIALLIASYIRPEFMLGMILIFSYTLWHTIRKYKDYNIKYLIQGWFSVILIILLSAYFFSLPWIMDHSKRGYFAICQHFFLNYSSWYPSKANSWYLTPEIIKNVFGDADSVSGLFMANPLMLMKHMLYNLYFLGKFMFGITFIHNKLILPDSSRFYLYIEAAMMFAAFLGWLIVTWLKNSFQVKQNFIMNRKLFLLLAFIAIPSLFASVIIYPRWHYLIVPVYFMLAFTSVFVLSNIEKHADKKTLLLAGFLIFVLTRTFSTAWADTSDKISHTTTLQEVKKVVKEVKNTVKSGSGKHFILDSHTGIGIYMMPEIQPVYDYKKAADLTGFLTNNGINMVIADSIFIFSPAYKLYKPQWDSFLVYPCKYGFKIQAISIKGYTLYVEDELLKEN